MKKINISDVISFYDKSTLVYYKQTGGYIQGYSTPEGFLAKYLIEKLNISKDDVILDAGCGMGKLSIDIAKIIDVKIIGITISSVQKKIADELIEKENLTNRITIILLNFHYLNDYFKKETFDKIIFNESLFHSSQLKSVLSGASFVLKKNGILYAKDIYTNDTGFNIIKKIKNSRVINKIYKNYSYKSQKPTDILVLIKMLNFHLLSFDSPPYEADFNATINFEKEFGFDTYKSMTKIKATHWRELVIGKKD